jgi:hypothetical protein
MFAAVRGVERTYEGRFNTWRLDAEYYSAELECFRDAIKNSDTPFIPTDLKQAAFELYSARINQACLNEDGTWNFDYIESLLHSDIDAQSISYSARLDALFSVLWAMEESGDLRSIERFLESGYDYIPYSPHPPSDIWVPSDMLESVIDKYAERAQMFLQTPNNRDILNNQSPGTDEFDYLSRKAQLAAVLVDLKLRGNPFEAANRNSSDLNWTIVMKEPKIRLEFISDHVGRQSLNLFLYDSLVIPRYYVMNDYAYFDEFNPADHGGFAYSTTAPPLDGNLQFEIRQDFLNISNNNLEELTSGIESLKTDIGSMIAYSGTSTVVGFFGIYGEGVSILMTAKEIYDEYKRNQKIYDILEK